MSTITFFVPGIPATQGSKRHIGHGILIDSNKRLPGWRSAVAYGAMKAMEETPPMTGPVQLIVHFILPRPKNHYHTGKRNNELRADAPIWHTKIGDLSKLVRAVEDAMKGIVWKDDSQVAKSENEKVYGVSPGAQITITPIGGSTGGKP